ncbi:MAG: hypothetical protein LBG97_05380 [Coriobacteriales bacterium]|jgi:predicted ATP-dependent endonuclease of OLD family|nr:hypothetical protein [Coriobacteriales bacterium]
MGKIEIYIGPNGYGKTYRLNEINKELQSCGVSVDNILFLESELTLAEESRDTRNDSATMEFIIFELLEKDKKYLAAKKKLEASIDDAIVNSIPMMNSYIDDVLKLSNQQRNVDFITLSDKKEYKKIVKINQTEISGSTAKMGSGQKMQLVLRLACSSSKSVLILDEPEKYSHPSLLHETARRIEEFASKYGKSVYLATHSPKLLSMLDFDYCNLYVVNDRASGAKEIDFADAAAKAKLVFGSYYGQLSLYSKRYYENGNSLKETVKQVHNRSFIEALFSKRVFLCEGIYDEIFINWVLRKHNHFFDDYCIFTTNGKFHMPAFAELFKQLGIDVFIYFDCDDDASNNIHKSINDYLKSKFPNCSYCFTPNIEGEIGFKASKNSKNSVADFLEFLESFQPVNNYELWI